MDEGKMINGELNKDQQIRSDVKGVINKATQYLRDHKGLLRVDLGINLWLKTKQIDKLVSNGDIELVRDLFFAFEQTKPGLGEYKLLEGMVNRYSDRCEDMGNPDSVVLMLNMYSLGTKEQKQRAAVFIDRNFNEIEAMGEVSEHIHLSMWNYRLERALGNDEIAQKCRDKTRGYLSEKGVESEILGCSFQLENTQRSRIVERMKGLVMNFGLNEKMIKDIVGSWTTLNWESGMLRKGIFEEMLNKNIQVLVGLVESKDVGLDGVIRLYRDYGITHFGRYTAEMLGQQLSDEVKDVPYGVAMAAWADWNGALTQDKALEIKKQLLNSANVLGYKVKFVEARNKVTVVRRIKDLARKFPEHKIAFKHLEGHGDPDGVQMGVENVKDNYLTTDDLKKETAGKMKQFYTDSCPTLFVSCSTGLGIGPAYSKYGNSYSMAPDGHTYLSSVELKIDTGGNLFFDGSYDTSNKASTKTVLSFSGKDATSKVESEKEKLYQISHREMLNDPESMKMVWENESILLGILKEKKLDVLKEELRKKYGANIIYLSSGFGGSEYEGDVGGRELDMNLAEETTDRDWGVGFLEGLGSECSYVYRNRKDGKCDFWPEIRVIGENGSVIDRYKIDMSDLWPENIGK